MQGDIPSWLYIGGCLVVPMVWGVVCSKLFRRIDAKRKARRARQSWVPPVDYSI